MIFNQRHHFYYNYNSFQVPFQINTNDRETRLWGYEVQGCTSFFGVVNFTNNAKIYRISLLIGVYAPH